MRKNCVFVLALCLLATANAGRSDDDHWVWRRYNRQERAFRDVDRSGSIRNSNDDKYRRELYSREPTTKRPLPGEPENDEIEDYADVDASKPASPNVGTRQFNPYGAGGGGGLYNAGQFSNPGGAFGGFPSGLGGGYGAGSPGVLVGPGGPTGIIGRPQQQQFPVAYQPGFGGFNGAQNGLGGYPGPYSAAPNFGGGAGIGGLSGSGYPGLGGQGNFGGFPGSQPGLGQYPTGAQYPFGQFPGAEFNGNGNQFPTTAGGQFPGPGQYPGNQFAGNAGPQYTEGYGLATPNGQLGFYGPNQGIGPGGFGFDESATQRNTVAADGKSAKNVELEGRSNSRPAVNDKLNQKS